MVTGSLSPHYEVVSDCPRCGSPIYIDSTQNGREQPPQPFFTCSCRTSWPAANWPAQNPQQQLLTEPVLVPYMQIVTNTPEPTSTVTVTGNGPRFLIPEP